MDRETAPARVTISAAGIAAVLLTGAWCGPALGSSGIDISRERADHSMAGPNPAARSPSLTAHADSALAEILDDDAVKMPALSDAVTRSNIESGEEPDKPQDDTAVSDDSPAIITRLPGVSDAALPSFRRQMYRTDI